MKLIVLMLAATLPLASCILEPDQYGNGGPPPQPYYGGDREHGDREHGDREHGDREHGGDRNREHCDHDGHCDRRHDN